MAAPRSQRGVVLLIALIVLVAMTLAGIGMMRSVDTGTVIAGNMAFRQSTEQAADAGIVAAFNQLLLAGNSINPVDRQILNFNNGQPCPVGATSPLCTAGVINFPGYSSTPLNVCEVTGGCTVAQTRWWESSAPWIGAPAITVVDPVNGSTIAKVRYLIHRMCVLPNEVGTVAPQAVATGNQLCHTEAPPCGGQQANCAGYRYFYRITSRTEGVRNTVTYAQQIAKIGI